MNRQVVIRRPGGPEVLAVVEGQIPSPGSGMVRVRVLAAGVAYADILMRKGVYPGAPRMPFVPGYDIVGVVDALGPGVAGPPSASTSPHSSRRAAIQLTAHCRQPS
jgi:NADPH:quinone reductase-like Zn-dependent oxidoreductase